MSKLKFKNSPITNFEKFFWFMVIIVIIILSIIALFMPSKVVSKDDLPCKTHAERYTYTQCCSENEGYKMCWRYGNQLNVSHIENFTCKKEERIYIFWCWEEIDSNTKYHTITIPSNTKVYENISDERRIYMNITYTINEGKDE